MEVATDNMSDKYVSFFLLGDSPESEFYMPTFRNTVFYLHKWCKAYTTYKDGKKCFETSAHKIQIPGIHRWCKAYITYENGTQCSETSAYKIQMLGTHTWCKTYTT